MRTSVTLLAVLMIGGTARAGLTRIDVAPTPIIALGDTAYYTAVIDNLDGPAVYNWSYKRILSNCDDTAYISQPGGTHVLSTRESYVGMFRVRCEATFFDFMTGFYWTEEETVDVSISPPTHYQLVSGTSTDFTFTPGGPEQLGSGSGTLTFQVYCGTRMVGADPAANVQERIWRPQSQFDSGWTDPQAGKLWLGMGGRIFDVKTVNETVPGSWNNIGVGTTFDDFYQGLRIVYVDSCGAVQYTLNLGTKHYIKKKTGTNTWQVIEVP